MRTRRRCLVTVGFEATGYEATDEWPPTAEAVATLRPLDDTPKEAVR